MAVKGAFGWSDIDVVLFGKISIHIDTITYKVAREKVNGYGRGSEPVRRGRGKKTYEDVSMTLGMTEVIEIRNALKAKYGDGFDFTDIEPFDIPISYDNGEVVVVDVLKDFEFTSDGGGGGKDDADIMVEFSAIVSKILFNQTI